jgi:hypothetical protein
MIDRAEPILQNNFGDISMKAILQNSHLWTIMQHLKIIVLPIIEMHFLLLATAFHFSLLPSIEPGFFYDVFIWV